MVAQLDAGLVVKDKIDHVESLAREPMLRQHPSGTLFVTGYKNESDSPQLWCSEDMGKNWRSVNVGTLKDGAVGNSDVDLHIDTDGNIYLLSMTYTKLPEKLEDVDFSKLKGERIDVGISRDEGVTWSWTNISKNEYDDRPWISETTDGCLHIIWNDGNGIHHSLSENNGLTWKRQSKISDKGGSSFMAAGQGGQLAVRVAPLSASAHKEDEAYDFIRLSTDNGHNWKTTKIPGHRVWTKNLSGIPRWVEPMAWDDENRLFLLWSEGTVLKLAVTTDYGESWDEYNLVEGLDTLYFPYLELSDQELLCTWTSGFKNEIRHHAGIINIDGELPEITTIELEKLDIWSRFQVGEPQRSTGGEYFPIIQLQNGHFGVVTTVQNYPEDRLGFTWWEVMLK